MIMDSWQDRPLTEYRWIGKSENISVDTLLGLNLAWCALSFTFRLERHALPIFHTILTPLRHQLRFNSSNLIYLCALVDLIANPVFPSLGAFASVLKIGTPYRVTLPFRETKPFGVLKGCKQAKLKQTR